MISVSDLENYSKSSSAWDMPSRRPRVSGTTETTRKSCEQRSTTDSVMTCRLDHHQTLPIPMQSL